MLEVASSGGEYPYAERGYTVAQKQKQTRYFRNEKWNKAALHFIATTANDDTRRIYAGTLRRLISFVQQKYGRPRTPDKITKEDIEEFLHQPVQKNRRKGQPPSA